MIKRSNGLGSVYQRFDGKWVAQLSIGPRSARRFIRRTCRTQVEAEEQLATLPLPEPYDPVAFFWGNVAKSDGCWLWTGRRDHNGYGQLKVDRRLVQAHRFSLEMALGGPLGELFACHHCDVKPCVRPDHLFAGTALENARDYVEKQAQKKSSPESHVP